MGADIASNTEPGAWTGIVAALPAEIQCLGVERATLGSVKQLSPAVRVVLSGLGPARAEHAVEGLIKLGAKALVSFGVAGALGPALRPGDLLLPDAVLYRGTRYAADGGWRKNTLKML